MPELPEVEVVKKSLLSKVIKLKIKKVKVKNVNLRYKIDKKSINSLKNKKIISIKRVSKYILINFSSLQKELKILFFFGPSIKEIYIYKIS